jgi:hypothetical protein
MDLWVSFSVGLAAPTASLAVRSVALHNQVTGRGDMPGNACAPGAVALDSDLRRARAVGVRREFEAEKSRLLKEQSHYETALDQLRESGSPEEVAAELRLADKPHVRALRAPWGEVYRTPRSVAADGAAHLLVRRVESRFTVDTGGRASGRRGDSSAAEARSRLRRLTE